MDNQQEHPWLLPDIALENFFRKAKFILEKQNTQIFFDWSRPALSEVAPNVERTLAGKFSACNNGYRAAKIAGAYAFWIAKLKPGFGIMTNHLAINEYLAISVAFSIIRDRININIHLSKDELLDICDTLRYHTSSPHTMMIILSGWIERERLRRR